MAGKRKRASSDNAASAGDNTEMEEAPVAVLSECPFKIEYKSPAIKKAIVKKAKQAAAKRQKSTVTSGEAPPKQELDQTVPEDMPATIFTINPKKQWDTLKKYRHFVVGTESFALQEYIFVNHDNIPHGIDITNMDDHKFWVARVLEIRAIDEAHVYLRVYWLYWPEELPGGRAPYHGKKELIASNHMEIIDAMTVSGRANVKHWLELDDEEDLPDLFWRQKFDFPSGTLMEVREHCRCHGYYNPDKMMLGCTHCKNWLHEECIVSSVQEYINEALIAGQDPMSPTVALTSAPKPTANDEDKIVTAPPEATLKKGRGRKSLMEAAVSAAPATPTTPANGKKGGKGKGGKTATPAKQLKEVEEKFEVTVRSDSGSNPVVIVKDLRDGAAGATREVSVVCLLCHNVIS
ncbi:hypothetical protein P167DRAFT_503589 [Morchella conica CCBAS932]|uniref:BAH domain-containing protein n=1 Tax=Morchella conica CCBAS932 TaxID=1392247 RepID=A0A3N4L8J0_9PEZI|nr:hypothetical protein P167DRAFT_503589 [Morchella conica CCBAS932]